MKCTRLLGVLLSLLLIVTMIPAISFGAGLPFTDVPADAWYYSDVKNAYDTGLINGRTATSFAPNANMTYAEAVKLAACMHQKHTVGVVSLRSGDPWYQTYVDYAKTTHIISKDYTWNQTATRAGYVEIFAHALPDSALQGRNSIADGSIPDVGMSHPQAVEIYKLYRAGILMGMDSRGAFHPDSNIKRSEVSAILTRMMNASARKDLTLGDEGKTNDPAPQGGEELKIVKEPLNVEITNGAAVLSITVSGQFDKIAYVWEKKVGDEWRDVATLNTEKVTYNISSSAVTILSEDGVEGNGEYRCSISAFQSSDFDVGDILVGQAISRTVKVYEATKPLVAYLAQEEYRAYPNRYYTFHNGHQTDQIILEDKHLWEESAEHVLKAPISEQQFQEWYTYGPNPWNEKPDPSDMYIKGQDLIVKIGEISGGRGPYTFSWEMGPNKYGGNPKLIEGYNCIGQGTDTIYVHPVPGVTGDEPVEMGYIDCKVTDSMGTYTYATCWRYAYGKTYLDHYVHPYALRSDHYWFGDAYNNQKDGVMMYVWKSLYK